MHLWARGYLVRTAGIDSTVIQNDMKEQEDEEKARRGAQGMEWRSE